VPGDGSRWGGVPLGCSVQTWGDWAPHLKLEGPNCNNGQYQLACFGSELPGGEKPKVPQLYRSPVPKPEFGTKNKVWVIMAVKNAGNNEQRETNGADYCVDDKQRNEIQCNRASCQQTSGVFSDTISARYYIDEFEDSTLPYKTYTIKSQNGRYCSDEEDRIVCNRDAVGAWERFRLEPAVDLWYETTGQYFGRWYHRLIGGHSGKFCSSSRREGGKGRRPQITCQERTCWDAGIFVVYAIDATRDDDNDCAYEEGNFDHDFGSDDDEGTPWE